MSCYPISVFSRKYIKKEERELQYLSRLFLFLKIIILYNENKYKLFFHKF